MLLLRETPKAVPKLDGHVDCLVAGTGLKAAIKIQSIEKVGVTAIFRGLIPPDWIALFRVQPEAKRKRGAMLPRILIVDANARMRRTIRRVVEDRTDLQVCGEGTDGQDAIRRAEQLKPDLVILDLTMPKMNGLQVARAIKKLLPKVRLVLFSLGENQLVRKAAKAAGINAVASKREGSRSLFLGLRTALQSAA
jgi:CheY-like chemotaxis protein